MKRICIVTPGYLTSNPRTVKEADALAAAGFDVRVVHSLGNLENLRANDEKLVAGKCWKADAVRWSPFRADEKGLYRRTKVRCFLARNTPAFAAGMGRIAEYAEGRIYGELARLAAADPADLFIGHYPEGLASAAHAARRYRALYGYDIEDLHTGEQASDRAGRRKTRRIDTIERRYLPDARHVTAASDLMADAIAARYGVRRPIAVYNAFPLSDRSRIDGLVKDRRGPALSLYWFSQTVGEDRGLQDAIRAAAKLDNAQLHVRGALEENVRQSMEELARETGLGEKLVFHAPVHPDELLSRAAEHDVGLALEPGATESDRLTVSNKLFFYFLAGLAIAASDIPGQRFVLERASGAGFLYPAGDAEALARVLESLAAPGALERAKSSSRAAADRWNADAETEKIVRSVKELLR